VTLHPTRRLQDGRYILLGLLRTGGEAEVWRALDTVAGEQRALKVWLAADGGAEAAARELELARRLVHPHVVRVDDAFVDGDHAFVVMELAEGSLAERVATMGPLTPDEAFAALEGPLQALEAAHAAGIVHRDVKPHNLLVFGALDGAFDGALPGDGGGRAIVKLADFGIAQVRAEGLTRTRSGAFLGSLPFMSPEQRRDPRNVGPATDVYAAAVTLAWLVTGKAPGDLYLPETLEELRAELRGRGLEKREIERVVGVVEAGGRLEARGRGVRGAFGSGGGEGLAPPRWWRGPRSLAGAAGAVAILGGLALTVSNVPSIRASGAMPPAERNTLPSCPDAATRWSETNSLGPRETLDADAADVDGDGILDYIFANNYSESTTVWWGRPAGIPKEHDDFPSGRQSMAPAVADLDGDGHADFLVALTNESAVGVLHGVGNRSFAPMETVFQDPPLHDATVADLNGDGSPDLVGIELAGEQVLVRLASGGPGGPFLSQQVVLNMTSRTGYGRLLQTKGGARAWWPEGTDVLSAMLSESGVSSSLRRIALPGRVSRVMRDASHRDAVVARVAGGPLVDYVRLLDGQEPCVLATLDAERNPRVFNDIDADGVIDYVETRTCQYCESNHVFARGLR
jgi:serine/threonine protein kinase